ncbi:hypothetical protein [Rhodoplanes sp. SY1]|uniref:hypothetical protein n=1 Tax=Rhodoplanes sp. SY1 TaxID=3166646 RepID=UPI0038B5095D
MTNPFPWTSNRTGGPPPRERVDGRRMRTHDPFRKARAMSSCARFTGTSAIAAAQQRGPATAQFGARLRKSLRSADFGAA